MIGIGVGIDYALLIVTRYREGLHDGLGPRGGGPPAARHLGPRRRLRRHHGRHLAPRHVPDEPGLHAQPGVAAILAVLMTMLAAITLAAGAARLRRTQHRPLRPAAPPGKIPAESNRTVLVPLEPRHPGTPLAGADRERRLPDRAGASAAFAAPRLRRRRQPPGRRTPPGGLTTCSLRASAPASTGRSWSSSSPEAAARPTRRS